MALATLPFASAAATPKRFAEIWKDAGCGCCDDWVKHLQADGFATKVHEGGNGAMREKLGMPQKLGSCHTALIGGYAIEGHVPARDVRRLLAQRPSAIGLTVPGMPAGSPGMDGKIYGNRRDPYDVLLVGKDGTTSVFASYNKT